MSEYRRIVVVGNGIAGLTAGETLRGAGYGGELVVVGDETHPPYSTSRRTVPGWAAAHATATSAPRDAPTRSNGSGPSGATTAASCSSSYSSDGGRAVAGDRPQPARS